MPKLTGRSNQLIDIDIDAVIREFQAQIRKNKMFIMHRIYSESTNKAGQDLIMYDKKNMSMVFCESLAKHTSNEKNQVVLRDHLKFKWKWLFEKGAEFGVVGGLSYTGISICRSVVLNYFSENFDYHCENNDFLVDLLSSEISADQVSFSVLPSSIFQHKVDSWTAFLAGMVCLLKQSSFKFRISKMAFRFGNLFQVVSNRSIISPQTGPLSNCFVGPKSEIADRVRLRHTVLVENCRIESESDLLVCYLSAGTVVEHKIQMRNCVILQENVQVTRALLEERQIKHASSGDGRVVIENLLILVDGAIACVEEPESFLFADDESYNLESEHEEEETGDYFEREIKDALTSLAEDFGNLEQIKADIISLRFSQNKSFQDCLSEILIFIWSNLFRVKDSRVGIFSAAGDREPLTKAEFMRTVNRLKGFKPLLEKFAVSSEEELFILDFIKEKSERHGDLLCSTLMQMVFKMEVIQAETIIRFFSSVRDQDHLSEFDQKFVNDLAMFVEYLEKLDEDSESESDEDSEDDEDEDEEDEDEDEEDKDSGNDSATDKETEQDLNTQSKENQN